MSFNRQILPTSCKFSTRIPFTHCSSIGDSNRKTKTSNSGVVGSESRERLADSGASAEHYLLHCLLSFQIGHCFISFTTVQDLHLISRVIHQYCWNGRCIKRIPFTKEKTKGNKTCKTQEGYTYAGEPLKTTSGSGTLPALWKNVITHLS